MTTTTTERLAHLKRFDYSIHNGMVERVRAEYVRYDDVIDALAAHTSERAPVALSGVVDAKESPAYDEDRAGVIADLRQHWPHDIEISAAATMLEEDGKRLAALIASPACMRL